MNRFTIFSASFILVAVALAVAISGPFHATAAQSSSNKAPSLVDGIGTVLGNVLSVENGGDSTGFVSYITYYPLLDGILDYGTDGSSVQFRSNIDGIFFTQPACQGVAYSQYEIGRTQPQLIVRDSMGNFYKGHGTMAEVSPVSTINMGECTSIVSDPMGLYPLNPVSLPAGVSSPSVPLRVAQ